MESDHIVDGEIGVRIGHPQRVENVKLAEQDHDGRPLEFLGRAGVQAQGDAQSDQGNPHGVHRRTEKTKSNLR